MSPLLRHISEEDNRTLVKIATYIENHTFQDTWRKKYACSIFFNEKHIYEKIIFENYIKLIHFFLK